MTGSLPGEAWVAGVELFGEGALAVEVVAAGGVEADVEEDELTGDVVLVVALGVFKPLVVVTVVEPVFGLMPAVVTPVVPDLVDWLVEDACWPGAVSRNSWSG